MVSNPSLAVHQPPSTPQPSNKLLQNIFAESLKLESESGTLESESVKLENETGHHQTSCWNVPTHPKTEFSQNIFAESEALESENGTSENESKIKKLFQLPIQVVK